MKKQRKQRTPEELIAAHEAKLERLRLKQLKVEAANDPSLAPLFDELSDIKKSIIAAKKILGTGPQSADARIEKHQIWITRIEREREDAMALLSLAEGDKKEIESKIQKAIEAKA